MLVSNFTWRILAYGAEKWVLFALLTQTNHPSFVLIQTHREGGIFVGTCSLLRRFLNLLGHSIINIHKRNPLRSAFAFFILSLLLRLTCLRQIDLLTLVLRFYGLSRSLVCCLRYFLGLIFTFLTPSYHTWQFLEELLDIVTCLCRYLHIGESKLIQLRFGKARFNSPLSFQIAFVAYYHYQSLLSSHFSYIINPFAETGERIGV